MEGGVEGTTEGEMADEDGKAGTLVLLGELLGWGMTVWFGLGGGMES